MKLKNLLKPQKKLRKFKGFTLVELIVVITILVILGTIAFISFTGYSQNSRDSKRIADIGSIQKSLELYITEKGTYPIPDNNANITYSGSTAWIEGTVGDNVITNIENINKKPLDPLTGNEYTYSITSSKTEYQIGAISESGQMGYKLPINQTHAASTKKAIAMIRGTYNERFLRVQSGTINWILALPSIIATDISQTEVQTILDNKKLVYDSYQNIPHSYNNAGYIMTGGFDYTNPNPQIYSGSLKTLADDTNKKVLFVTSLKEAYNGTILQGDPNYQDIVNINPSNQTGTVNLVNNFINLNVGGIKTSNINLPITPEPETPPTIYNCTGTLVTSNATITHTGGLTATTNYQTSDSNEKCYYQCTSLYTGADCDTLITYTVSFDETGGTTVSDKSITYNTAVGTLSNPTKTGYTFNGWFTAASGGTQINAATVITGNVTYYAQWTINTYTVSFDETGGTTVSDKSITYNTAVGTLSNPTKNGYTFSGWFTLASGGTQITDTTLITGNITYYAQWLSGNPIASCTGVGQIRVATTKYTGCDTFDITVCSGNGAGYTLAACNAGTTVAGTGAANYGKYYQWGNNYGSLSGGATTTTLANATGYGPGNYYTSTLFIRGSLSYRYDWTTIQNDNLWGNTTNTSIARQGPCATGYHIPSQQEWAGIVTSGGWEINGIDMMNALNLPFAGYREWDSGNINYQSTRGYYQSSSPSNSASNNLYFYSTNIYPTFSGNGSRAYGLSIRCFKN